MKEKRTNEKYQYYSLILFLSCVQNKTFLDFYFIFILMSIIQQFVRSAIHRLTSSVSSTPELGTPNSSGFSFFPSQHRKKSLPLTSSSSSTTKDKEKENKKKESRSASLPKGKLKRSKSTPSHLSSERSTSIPSHSPPSRHQSTQLIDDFSFPSELSPIKPDPTLTILPPTYYLENGASITLLESLKTQFSPLWRLWNEEAEEEKRSNTLPSKDLLNWLWTPHDTLTASCCCEKQLPPFVFYDEWTFLKQTLIPTESILRRQCIACYLQDHKLYTFVLSSMTKEPSVPELRISIYLKTLDIQPT